MSLMVVSVDYTEGGHYTVNKFVGEDEIIAVHEDNIQRRTLWPTFDHGVILVLLRKLHSPPVETETYQDSSGEPCFVYDRDMFTLLTSNQFLLTRLISVFQLSSSSKA